MKKILILSPHSDDAVLSCADHILYWKKRGYFVTVCRMFVKYEVNNISKDAKKFMAQSGLDNKIQFEKVREKEDISALTYLQVDHISLDFIDGLFRINNKDILYPSFEYLFNGKISKFDFVLINNISRVLTNLEKKHNYIIAPLGIGNHIDHRITYLWARNSIHMDKLFYYFDAPYYFKVSNWSAQLFKSLLFNWKSIRMTTLEKRKALNFYTSQKKFLFRDFKTFFFNKEIQFYPEIIISLNNRKELL